jgi:hypothetical protein
MAFVAVGTAIAVGGGAALAGAGTAAAIAAGVAAGGVGASIYGQKKASSAAKAASERAAAAQLRGQDAAIYEQRRQFDAMREILSPYINAGQPGLTQPYIGAGPGAIQQMQRLAGLGGEQERQRALYAIQQSPQYNQLADITKEKIDELYRTREKQREKIKGEDALAEFDLSTNAAARNIEAQGYAQQQALFKPILEDKQYEQLGIEQQRQAIQQIEQGPLYQELAKQGEEAILAAASATGRRGSDGTQSALARYRPQLLNQLIDQQYARLGGLSNVGQAAAQNMLNLGQASAAGQAAGGIQSGNAIANLLSSQGAAQAAGIQGAAAAQAAGYTGMANAIGSGLQNFALLNQLSGGFGGGGGGGYESFAGSGDWTMGQGAQSGFMSTNV